jgi:hypothetical protein
MKCRHESRTELNFLLLILIMIMLPAGSPFRKKIRSKIRITSKKQKCSGGDLNPHALRHTPLKRTCLPFHHPSAWGNLFRTTGKQAAGRA